MGADRVSELYRRYGPLIYQRCRRLLRESAAAEDATQETFLRVHKHLARAPSDDEALVWIYRVATNYCLNELRNQKLRPLAVAELPEAGEESFERLFLDADATRRLLAAVPEKLSAVATLHYLEGLDQGEVARVLGLSRRTVVYRLAEFQERSRQLLVRARSVEAA